MDIEKIELFSSLNNSELSHVREIVRRMHVSRGESIFKEGDFEKHIYIVESGQVEIYKRSHIHGDQTLTVLKNGDYFGEMAFFERNATRSASARALQATVLNVIESQDFEKLLHNNPSISLKLLSTLSQRLRETTIKVTGPAAARPSGHSCQLLAVASARDGYGKTTFATCIYKMIATELHKKVLFIDLDLYFGSATQVLGIHSPRSIIDICSKMRLDEQKFDIFNEAVRIEGNCYAIPAPRSFLEAEHVHGADVAKLLRHCRSHFDYIVIDTGSVFDENLFTVFDTSDFIFFMVDFANIGTVTDNVRFFQGIAKLSFPKERVILLANNINKSFSISKSGKIFPYPIIGAMPRIAAHEPEFGKTLYDDSPTGPYQEVLRLLIRNVLKEETLGKTNLKPNMFAKLFGDKDPEQTISMQLDLLHEHSDEPMFKYGVGSKDVRSQVKYIRYNMVFGYIDEAEKNLNAFLEYSPNAAPLYELLGELYLIKEQTSQALESLKKAVAIDPEQHVALAYLSSLTGDEHNYQKALSIIENKIVKTPSYLDLRNDYAKMLMCSHKYEEAAKQLEKALEKNPNYIEAKINLARCLAGMGKGDAGMELLFSIKDKCPKIYITLGEILYDSGRLYHSYKAYNIAANDYPSYPGLRARLSELGNYLKKLESVIDLHESFVNKNPCFPDLRAKLGNFYHLAGKTEIAISQLNKALEINPKYTEATLLLEKIKKDMIWRLSKKHLEEIDQINQIKELRGIIHFECCKDNNHGSIPEVVLQIKNVRTKRMAQKALTPEHIEKGEISCDCKLLGSVLPDDILIFQIADVKSGKILRFAPHYIEHEEVEKKEFIVKLESEIHDGLLNLNNEFAKFFLVSLTSDELAKKLLRDQDNCRVTLKNLTNNIQVSGKINPENTTQILFVMSGDPDNKREDISVHLHDKLNLKFIYNNKTLVDETFEIAIEDIKNFSKNLTISEKAHLEANA